MVGLEDRKIQIRDLYLQGKGQREIARILGISQPAVRKDLVKLKLITSPDNQKGDNSSGVESITIQLGADEELVIEKRGSYSQGKYFGRCKSCHGFFLEQRKGQVYCCNTCASGKPCSCRVAKRARLVII
jgi:predicted transcriptional regulator